MRLHILFLVAVTLLIVPYVVYGDLQISPNLNPVGNTITVTDRSKNDWSVIVSNQGTIRIKSAGRLSNYSTLNNNGTLTNDGMLLNVGTLNNDGGMLANYARLTNHGMLLNGGLLTNGGTLTNDGTLTNNFGLANNGTFDNTDGTFVNNGILSAMERSSVNWMTQGSWPQDFHALAPVS